MSTNRIQTKVVFYGRHCEIDTLIDASYHIEERDGLEYCILEQWELLEFCGKKIQSEKQYEKCLGALMHSTGIPTIEGAINELEDTVQEAVESHTTDENCDA